MPPKRQLKRKKDNVSLLLDSTFLKKLKTSLIDDPVAALIFKELCLSDAFLNSGKVLAWALSPEDPEFIDIHDYVARSQNAGYGGGIKILSILRIISKAGDFQEFDEMPEYQGKLRMMLFHGTKKKNVASILENGLRLPYAGRAIFFADRAAKSSQYLDYTNGSIGYMFLCDVLLDKMFERTTWSFQLPPGYDSVKLVGSGSLVPDYSQSKVVGGCTWPLGRGSRTSPANSVVGWFSSLFATPPPPVYGAFNEYLVYKPEQVHPKYLLKVQITSKMHEEKLY